MRYKPRFPKYIGIPLFLLACPFIMLLVYIPAGILSGVRLGIEELKEGYDEYIIGRR